jgi:hypothetical protein
MAEKKEWLWCSWLLIPNLHPWNLFNWFVATYSRKLSIAKDNVSHKGDYDGLGWFEAGYSINSSAANAHVNYK